MRNFLEVGTVQGEHEVPFWGSPPKFQAGGRKEVLQVALWRHQQSCPLQDSPEGHHASHKSPKAASPSLPVGLHSHIAAGAALEMGESCIPFFKISGAHREAFHLACLEEG